MTEQDAAPTPERRDVAITTADGFSLGSTVFGGEVTVRSR